VNILGHIWGFNSVLKDGEMEYKDCCIVDSMYMGIIPHAFDSRFTDRYRNIIAGRSSACFSFYVSKRLDKLWNDIKELVKARFIGIHRVANSIS